MTTRALVAPPPPSPLGLLGTIALVVGIGVVATIALDRHAHTCARCGNRWHHLGAFNGGSIPAHTCAQCGTEQWWKDRAGQRRSFVDGVLTGVPTTPVSAGAARPPQNGG